MVEQAIVNEWLSKADDDFSFAEANLHEGNSFYAQICFHFQQAAEKYLKAYILAKGLPFERVHDLIHLLRTCAAHSDSLTTLREDCILLSAYYIETRYPVHWPTNYSQEVAEQAQMAAHNIAQAVRSELNFTASQRPFSSNQGFTLVEMAIVLVIVGLLIGIGTGMVGVLSTAIKVREARDTLDANMQAIASWASSHNSIPDAVGFPAAAKSPQDSWGRDFIYLYDTNLYLAAPTKDTICGRRSTTLTVHTADPNATINNVAFVIISKSDDANLQTIASDAAITVSRAATGTVTLDANNSDIVRWVTLDELRSKVGCQGAPLKLVNNELPYGYNNTAYNATIFADGGVPGTYRWCIQNNTGVKPANMTFRNAANTADIPINIDCQVNVTEANWALSNSIVIGGTPIVTATGTDGLIYTSTQSHVAAAANHPTTGASWATNWQLGGTIASVWSAGLSYPSLSNTLTIFVRDNNDVAGTNDNIASKPFVFTINPN